MPNRILIGNTGSSTGDFPEEYHRQDNTGVYISRPGFDALTCNATDLLFSTDGTQSGFLQVLASGSALLDVSPELGTPFELKIEGLDIEAPRHSGPGTGGDSPVMVQWFIAAGLGKDFGSNVYDAMGGQGTDSWDGDGVDSYGLPNGYNPLHTGEWEHGGRKAFWQYPNDHPYHLSNTCITNDPSAFNFAWWQTPVSPENIEDALNWGLNTDTFDPYDPDAGPGMIQENIDIGGFDVFVGGVMEALFSIADSSTLMPAFEVAQIRLPGWENWEVGGGGDFVPVGGQPSPIFRRSSHLLKMPGDFCWAQTSIDTTATDGSLPQIDLYFYNASTECKFQLGYIIYREPGASG